MIGYPTYIMQEDSADLNNKYGDLNVKDDEYYQNTIRRNEFALKVCEDDIIFVMKLHNIVRIILMVSIYSTIVSFLVYRQT